MMAWHIAHSTWWQIRRISRTKGDDVDRGVRSGRRMSARGEKERKKKGRKEQGRTRWSFVVLQYRIRLALASLTLMRGRLRSSRRRWLCSSSRRSLSSDMDCFGRDDMMTA